MAETEVTNEEKAQQQAAPEEKLKLMSFLIMTKPLKLKLPKNTMQAILGC